MSAIIGEFSRYGPKGQTPKQYIDRLKGVSEYWRIQANQAPSYETRRQWSLSKKAYSEEDEKVKQMMAQAEAEVAPQETVTS